jgi:hypothetical protein
MVVSAQPPKNIADIGKIVTETRAAEPVVIEHGGSMIFAQMGMLQATHRHRERVFNPDRKDHYWGKRNEERSMTELSRGSYPTRHEPPLHGSFIE